MCVFDLIPDISQIPCEVYNTVANIKPRRTRYELGNQKPQGLFIAWHTGYGTNLVVDVCKNTVVDTNTRCVAFGLL